MSIASIEIKGSPKTLSENLGSVCNNAEFPICLDSLVLEQRLVGIVFNKINSKKSEIKIMYEEEKDEELLEI